MQNLFLPDKLHIRPLWRCFLCHEDLPEKQPPFVPVESPDWQRSIVSLFPWQNDDGSVRVLLRAIEDVELDNMLELNGFFIAGREDPPLAVTFCSDKGHSGLYCTTCRPDQVIFLAHKCCWKAINHPMVIPSLQLLKLAQHTRPIGPPRRQDVHHRYLSRQTQLDAFSTETALGRLLEQVVRRLPLELQCNILDYIEGSLFASLLKAKTVAPLLLDRLGPGKCAKPRTIHLGIVGAITSLHVRSSNILGRPFLTGIGFNQSECGSWLKQSECGWWVPVRSTRIRGLQYTLGEFGLRAVRIIYADGRCSAWLGDPSSSWVGNVMGSDLQMLRVLADDIRLIRLSFKEPDQTTVDIESGADNARPVLLDKDYLYIGLQHSFVQTCLETPKMPYYPDHRPCYYLPLTNGSEYVSGITVYMGPPELGIKGIASHGPSTQLLGQRTKCSIHMALSPGEYLNSLWMHISCPTQMLVRSKYALSVRAAHKYLIKEKRRMLKLRVDKVTTNRGRSHHFGPYFATQRREGKYEEFTQWAQVSRGRGSSSKITGIFVDALTYGIQQDIFDIGVTEEYEPGHGELLEKPSLTAVRHGFPDIPIVRITHRLTVMQSTATLDDIFNLQVRRVGHRCMGLRILHGDGSIEILGQWDPADTTSISTLYDVYEGPLAGLTFQTTPVDKFDSYMSDITPIVQNSRVAQQTTASPLTQNFTCEMDGQRLAWWFTPDLDSVSLCNEGRVKRIKRRSKIFPPSVVRY